MVSCIACRNTFVFSPDRLSMPWLCYWWVGHVVLLWLSVVTFLSLFMRNFPVSPLNYERTSCGRGSASSRDSIPALRVDHGQALSSNRPFCFFQPCLFHSAPLIARLLMLRTFPFGLMQGVVLYSTHAGASACESVCGAVAVSGWHQFTGKCNVNTLFTLVSCRRDIDQSTS